jgi:hypothetical protein
MTISMDSMDNYKSRFPRCAREDKTTDATEKLICHVTGVLMHGRPNPAQVYTWYDRFPASSDTIISILMDCLEKTQTENPEVPLPPTLYLHMDNCWRENKNRYVLSICNLLVAKGIFKKVKLSFLPVGHTHDDCDQMFSRFSDVFKINDILVLPELHRFIKESYTPTPIVQHMETMGMWSAWLQGFIPSIVEGHSKPRVFLFKRDPNDDVVRHW